MRDFYKKFNTRKYKAGGMFREDCGCNKTPKFAKGGTTVSEKWESRTGLPWKEAKVMGLTRGTLEDNLRLEQQIEAGKFDNLSKRNSNNTVQASYPQVGGWKDPVPKTMGNALQQSIDNYRKSHAGWDTPKKHPFEGLTNADAIHTYHKTFPSKDNYIVVDKEKGRLGVYNNGRLVTEERIFSGQVKGDADFDLSGRDDQYKTRTNKGQNMTGAGIYTVRKDDMYPGFLNAKTLKSYNRPPGYAGYYTAEPLLGLQRQDGSQSNMAIHAPANSRRVGLFKRDPNAKNVTAGCMSGRPGMCQSLKEDYNIGKGSKVYILPQEQGNKITLNPRDSVLRYEVLPENIRRYEKQGGFGNATSQKDVDQVLQERRRREAQIRWNNRLRNFLDYFKF